MKKEFNKRLPQKLTSISAMEYSIVLIKYCSIIMGLATIALGFSGIIGWYAHITVLFRYEPGTIAMVFNTALCFVLLGIAVISGCKKKYTITYVSIILVAIFAFLNLIEIIFDVNIGIDQLLFTHYDQLENAYPGRMAPNTAVCFLLLAASMFLATNKTFAKSGIIWAGFLSILTESMALVFFSGYVSNIQNAYIWSVKTPMSSTTAVGFILASASTILFVVKQALARKVEIMKYMPYITGSCLLIATCLLVQKIGSLEMQNGIQSKAPLVVLLGGSIVSALGAVLFQITYIALKSSKSSKIALSLVRATFEATPDGILVVDINNNVVDYNTNFLKMWNIDADEVSNYGRYQIIQIISDSLVNTEKFSLLAERIINEPEFEINDEVDLKNGNTYTLHVLPQIVDGKIVGHVTNYSDITEQKRLETELLHQATYDSLTSLPNRALITDLVNRNIELAQANNKSICVFLIDIDKFSQVNDLLGRSKGDILLKEIALRLKLSIADDCILGRIGGDEFLAINISGKDDRIPLIINKIINSFNTPFDLFGHQIVVSCCIGITYYPKDGLTTDVLLGNADIAMLRAKKVGRNQFQFFEQEMNEYTLRHIELEAQLHKAIEEKQLIVHYQPIIDIQENRIVGAEALVRWQHPKRGLIPPGEFIPVAETIGVIHKIGNFVLAEACKETKRWHEAGFTNLKVAVNVSAQQLKTGSFTSVVTAALRSTQLTPDSLELEITETTLLETADTVKVILQELNDMGISLSLDDFGTGYSSFNYIKQFRINKLKIDRTFVSGLNTSTEDRSLILAIIALGKSLNQTVLAEGIETSAQLEFIREAGCNQAQGFYFTRPLPADEYIEFMKAFTSRHK